MTDNTADIDHLLDKEKDACKLAAASLVQVLMHSDDTNLGYQTRSMQLFNVEGSAELENEIAKSLHRALKLKSSKIDREPRDQLLDASHTSSVLSAVCQSQPPQQPSQSRVVAHNPAAFEAAIEFSTDTSIASACLGHHNNTTDVYEAPQVIGGATQHPVSPMSSVSLSTRIAQLDALSQRMYETQPHLTTSTLPPPPLQTRSQPTTTTQQVSTTTPTTTTVQQQLSASQPAAVDYGFSSSSSDEECETGGTNYSTTARQQKHSQPDDLFSSNSDSDNDDQSAHQQQQQQQQQFAAGDDQFLDEALLDETQPINNAALAISDQSQSQQYLLHEIKPIDQLFSDSDEAE